MRILLISPKPPHQRLFSVDMGHPMALIALASVTPENHEIVIVNESRYSVDFNQDYDIIGITAYTNNINRAYEIADEFRKRRKTVVLGGFHVSALPEEAKQHADSVVVGEAEDTWPHLLKDFEGGRLKPFYMQKKPVGLDNISYNSVHPNLEIKGGNESIASLQATRGCPVGCDFCSITTQEFGNVFRKRPIKKVIEEIEKIPEKSIFFHDASLTIDPNYSKDLFREMIGLGKKFFCSGNANVLAKDDEFLKLAGEAGCVDWFVGFESVSQKTIDSIGKSTNKVEDYSSAVKKIHDYGMTITGALIFGFDTDAPDVFHETGKAILKTDVDFIAVHILTPFPGTPIYHKLEKEGRILTKNWSSYTFGNVVFQPKNFTPKELLDGTVSFKKEFYSIPNIMKRVCKKANMGIYPFLHALPKNLQYHFFS